jgi:hypothetical protein
MHEKEWVVIKEVFGSAEAEILRGVLEAQDIPVVLSQEGAGHDIYPVALGALGKVQIMVPAEQREVALEVLREIDAGEFEESSVDFLSDSPDEQA